MQHQKAADLAASEQGVGAEVGVDLLHAVLDQLVDLWLLRQIGVTGVGQVAALGPVSHRIKVDVDHDADLLAAVAIGHHLFDVRKKLEFVLHVLGREHGAVVGAAKDAADVFDAVDDLQVAVCIQKAGVAGVVPTIRSKHLGRGLRVFEILLEQTGRLDQNLAVVSHFDLDTGNWHANRVGTGLVVGLQADKHSSLGGAVELLEVDTDRSVKGEQVRPDSFACGVGHAHPAHAQVVAQGAIHQQVTQRVQQPIAQAQRLAVHARRPNPLRDLHERLEHAAHECPGVFHADHDAGQQPFKDARRGKVIGGTNLFEVDHDRGGRFRAVDHIATSQPLRVAEDVLPDPGRWQVGQHLFAVGQMVELGPGPGSVQQGVVRVHHALGVAGGARGEEHGRHIMRLRQRHLALDKIWVRFGKGLPGRQQFIERGQAQLVVIAQSARVIKINVRQAGALGPCFQQLVHLFLVFGKGEGHVGVVDREHAFRGGRVLVQRDRHRTERLRSQHGGIQARPVGAHHHHVLAPTQTGLVQAAGQVRHHGGEIGPAQGLPNTVFFFAHGRIARALDGMLK